MLLDLADNLHNTPNGDAADVLGSLFGQPGPLIPGVYPVLSPRRAFILEDLRSSRGLDNSSLATLAEERRVYEDLGQILRERGVAASKSRRATEAAQLNAVEFEAKLKHLARLYYGEDSALRRIERIRAMDASLQYFERRHKVEADPGAMEVSQLKRQAESLFRVLFRLGKLFNKFADTAYRIERRSEFGDCVQLFTIYSDRPTEVIAEGELYFGSTSGRTPAAFSIRWQTSCTETGFFSALDTILRSLRSNRWAERALELSVVPEDGRGFEGLIVFTNLGPLRERLDALPKSLKALTLAQIVEAAGAALQATPEQIVVHAVRIATPFGDFQLDIAPDSEGDREVFIIFHCDISKSISYLCEATGIFGVFLAKFRETVAEVTNVFRHPGQADEKGAALCV
ncbi:MAG: hypothetical protein WBE76_18120 [Terracidiphilus sp.]